MPAHGRPSPHLHPVKHGSQSFGPSPPNPRMKLAGRGRRIARGGRTTGWCRGKTCSPSRVPAAYAGSLDATQDFAFHGSLRPSAPMADLTPPTSAPRLSRLYLVPAGLAMALGILAVRAHFRQPHIPPAPGLGCRVTAIPSPDTLHTPSAYLELQACPHISETTLALSLVSPEDPVGSGIFSGTGPEDPRQWGQTLQVHWLANDTVEVASTSEVAFLSRRDSAGAVHFRYVALRRSGL